MKLTKTAKLLQHYVEEEQFEDRGENVQKLATCMGSESFEYALYDGGYLNPEDWIEGEDLKRLKTAISIVGEFRDLVSSLRDEF